MNHLFGLFDSSHGNMLEIELDYAFTYDFGLYFFC